MRGRHLAITSPNTTSFPVSHNLSAQIEFEFGQLRTLLAEGKTLITGSAIEPPDALSPARRPPQDAMP